MEPILLQNENETAAFATRLGRALEPESVVVLSGPLGAGKTRIVQGIVASRGGNREEVTSPTYTLCHHYRATPRVNHIDTYRIRDDDEFFELGFHELFESPEITVLEWGERFAHLLPDDYLQVTVQVVDEEKRMVSVKGSGSKSEQIMARFESDVV